MKIKMHKLVLPVFIFLLFFSGIPQKDMINTETVKNLDIQKYLGKWYEIARFPHSFEKGLVGVTATYSMAENGKIKVVNEGYKGSFEGELDVAVGKAKIPDMNDPAKLKVSFFWIFYGDYFIMELDSENYEWAVIGSSSPKYLWILSRKPQLEPAIFNDLIKRIEARGYQLDRLYKVPQKSF